MIEKRQQENSTKYYSLAFDIRQALDRHVIDSVKQ